MRPVPARLLFVVVRSQVSISLQDAVRGWRMPIFATIDGAKFQDFPSVATKADISIRSLFLGQDDARAIKTGPWFAALGPSQWSSMLRIEGAGDDAVFWHGTVEEEAAFHHFRRMNLIDVPRPKDAPPEPFAADPETVLFRYWDPSVLRMILPILDLNQRAQLFGPMDAVVIDERGSDGARVARRRPDWPSAEPGRIRLTSSQVDAISANLEERFHQKIESFLRQTSPRRVASLDDPALGREVRVNVETGRALGLSSERALGRWAWLMLVSGGEILRNKDAVAFILTGDGSPDNRVEKLLLGVGGALYRRERGL